MKDKTPGLEHLSHEFNRTSPDTSKELSPGRTLNSGKFGPSLRRDTVSGRMVHLSSQTVREIICFQFQSLKEGSFKGRCWAGEMFQGLQCLPCSPELSPV